MMRNVLRALLAVIVLGVLTGLVYPLVITGVAQLALDDMADGSLVRIEDRVVGSTSIGQPWEGTEWFHGRPSAVDYDAAASSGSNLGPTSQELADLVQERVDGVLELEGPYMPDLTAADIPADLVTASSSGLDPHIAVASAALQAPRIAEVRGLSAEEVRRLIDRHTQGRVLGFMGEPRVNVLELNLALEEMT
jgi:K+-transporting ATPase ATPase C chain